VQIGRVAAKKIWWEKEKKLHKMHNNTEILKN